MPERAGFSGLIDGVSIEIFSTRLFIEDRFLAKSSWRTALNSSILADDAPISVKICSKFEVESDLKLSPTLLISDDVLLNFSSIVERKSLIAFTAFMGSLSISSSILFSTDEITLYISSSFLSEISKDERIAFEERKIFSSSLFIISFCSVVSIVRICLRMF